VAKLKSSLQKFCGRPFSFFVTQLGTTVQLGKV
jgi:hypothetical protein